MNKKKSNLKQLSNHKNQVAIISNEIIGIGDKGGGGFAINGGRGNGYDHENSTIISALTNDTSLDNEGINNGSNLNDKKKKKRKVWKMEPIPVRPYIPVTLNDK